MKVISLNSCKQIRELLPPKIALNYDCPYQNSQQVKVNVWVTKALYSRMNPTSNTYLAILSRFLFIFKYFYQLLSLRLSQTSLDFQIFRYPFFTVRFYIKLSQQIVQFHANLQLINMQQIDLWQFLDQRQQHAIFQQINAIANRLKLPVPLSAIFQQIEANRIKDQISDVDPKGLTLAHKLIQMNRKALAELFYHAASLLTEFVKTTYKQFIQQKSIKYLTPDFQLFIRNECKCQGFQWQQLVPKKGSLWLKLNQQIKGLLQFTLQALVKKHEMSHLRWSAELQTAFSSFQRQLQPFRKQLQSIQPVDQQVTETLEKIKEEECANMVLYKSEIRDAITQLQQIQKVQQQKQKEETVTKEPMQIQSEEGSIFGFISSTKNKIVGKLSELFAQEEIPLKKQNQTDLKNLQKIAQLTEEEIKAVEDMCYLKCDVLLSRARYCFNLDQLSKLQFTIKKPLLDWEEDEALIVGNGAMVQLNNLKICKYRQNLAKVLRSIETGEKDCQFKYFTLALLFYRTLEEDYTTLAKRYLGKVLQSVQSTFESSNCGYLRAALKIFQTAHLKPSQFALKLESQMPYRSLHFQQSKKSKLIRDTQFLGNKFTPDSHQDQYSLKKGQSLQFQRLNYAKPTKNVTFLISGFLSQDTQKDLEWLGVIRALQDTELYGVVWRSGTKFDLVNYIGVAAGALALKGLKAKGGNIVALVQVAQIGFKVAKFFTQRGEEKQNNPFWGSLVNATQTGEELADKLISQFSDRHITLIGFSMGTEVIASCLQRLIDRKQEKLILKIVTMGGVADRDNVGRLVQRSSQPLCWVNFQSKNDYAVKYVYRVCTLGSKPIGSDGLKQIHGHEIVNWEVGDVVSGHMDFRPNLHGLCLISGLKHD